MHHGVRIKDSAIVAAAVLSNRYISDRFLPDKAIDLIDEAASGLRIEIDSMPAEIDQIERRITQLEIERQALKKEDDPASRERLAKLEKELAGLREQSDRLKLRWNAEKEIITRIRKLKSNIEQAKLDEQRATREGDLAKASEIRYGKLVSLEKQLAEANAELEGQRQSGRMLKEEVDEEDVARVVSKWTGIPVAKMLEGEVAKLVEDGRPPAAARGGAGRSAAAGGKRRAAEPGGTFRSRTARSAASSFWARRAWGKPNWRGRWPSFCLTTSAPCSASICRSIWRSTRWRG